MKPLSLIASLALLAALGGCASSSHLRDVRSFAAESSKLGGYSELSQRFRDTYQREQPYLTPAADARERALDVQRQLAYKDFLNIEKSVALYLETLGALAGDQQYDLDAPLKAIGTSIKAWPDSGLDDKHVTAYTDLTVLLARALSAPYQDQALQTMVRAGQEPLRQLLDAMGALLRYYDKTNANEKSIVLGTLEVEIPYADTPDKRLLATLAKVQQQNKISEYRQAESDYKVAERNLATIARAHQALLEHLDQLDSPPAQAALQQARRQLRSSHAALDSGD